MVSNLFHQTACKRRAAGLALLAILLIVVAPLISISLQKNASGVMPGMSHGMMMMMDMAQPMADSSAHSSHSEHHSPVDHAEACGYCVLLAHVPGLIFALALLLVCLVRRLRLSAPRPRVTCWRFTPWLWPDTRAPPQMSAFSIA